MPVKPDKSFPRRFFLFMGTVLMIYPIIRFISHRVPKKPVTVDIHQNVPQGSFLVDNDFILFVSDTDSWAASRKCTHLGCRLQYKEKENVLECPCHQSRFTTKGKIINGPAKRNLSLYKVDQNTTPPYFRITM